MTIYLIILLSILSQLGFSGSRVAVPLYALEMGASQFTVGTLVALYAVFPVLTAILIGRFVDRAGPMLPLSIGVVGMGLALLLPPLFPGVTALYVSCVLLGLSHQLFLIPIEVGVGALDGPEKRATNYAWLSMGWSIANFLGPVTAGFSIDHIGHVKVFCVLASFTVLPVVVLLLKPGLLPKTVTHAGKEKRGSVIELWRMPKLRTIFIAGGITSSARDLAQFYFPIYGHSLGISASAIGTILGLVSAAAFVIRAVIPFLLKRWTEAQVLTYSVFVAAFSFVLLPFVTNPYTLAAIAFLLGLGVGCAHPMSMSLVYVLTPHGRVAESLGLHKTVNNITHLVVPILFGTVGTAFGFTTVFFTNAALLVGGGVLMRNARLPGSKQAGVVVPPKHNAPLDSATQVEPEPKRIP